MVKQDVAEKVSPARQAQFTIFCHTRAEEQKAFKKKEAGKVGVANLFFLDQEV